MTMQDPISDLLTRIRNAQMAGSLDDIPTAVPSFIPVRQGRQRIGIEEEHSPARRQFPEQEPGFVLTRWDRRRGNRLHRGPQIHQVLVGEPGIVGIWKDREIVGSAGAPAQGHGGHELGQRPAADPLVTVRRDIGAVKGTERCFDRRTAREQAGLWRAVAANAPGHPRDIDAAIGIAGQFAQVAQATGCQRRTGNGEPKKQKGCDDEGDANGG